MSLSAVMIMPDGVLAGKGQGRLTFIDSLEKVGLIEIERRVGVLECGSNRVKMRNPDLVKEVVDILIGLGGGSSGGVSG